VGEAEEALDEVRVIFGGDFGDGAEDVGLRGDGGRCG
jgi:hypothetical protein